MYPSPEDLKKAGVFLAKQLQASIRIHIVRHPDDYDFEKNAPCFRVTVTAVDPDSGKVEDAPRWRDISATASEAECTFVVKAEKLAKRLARFFKRKPPHALDLIITAEPLQAWKDKYAALKQKESVRAGDQVPIRLVATLKSSIDEEY